MNRKKTKKENKVHKERKESKKTNIAANFSKAYSR